MAIEIYQPESTVLEALEKNSVEINSMCRDGFCGCCRTKLLEGEIEYFSDPLGCVSKGEILPCICKAKTPLVLEIAA